uniref:ABC transporter ATP-binding protein n=2 Tax=Litorilinea aerophila TaxID=1204385 RepID=A0A540VH43_9CHLR
MAEEGVPMITITRLTKKFGRFTAVHQLDLTIPAHQATALWGPNGAGKTTVIKCLLGLVRYEGEIRIDGLDARRQGAQARRRVGYVPQTCAFYDDLSVLATVRFFARLRQVPDTQAVPVLEQVGLLEDGEKPVAALSGGMRQRLALALALLGDPPILVLDEPTSNLDTHARAHFLHLLGRLKAEGKTILFTSHRLEEVEELADQVAVMEAGRLQFLCPGDQLARRLGLQVQIKLRMPGHVLEEALAILQADGFQARRNGTGLLVAVAPGEKARPIHTLSRAHIPVIDFEID